MNDPLAAFEESPPFFPSKHTTHAHTHTHTQASDKRGKQGEHGDNSLWDEIHL